MGRELSFESLVEDLVEGSSPSVVTEAPQESIESVARRVRAQLEQSGCSTRAACAEWSTVLAEALREAGHDAKVAQGIFWVHDVDREVYDLLDWCEHQWVMVGNTIVDITADQFNEGWDADEEFPPIVVAEMGTTRHDWSDEEPVFYEALVEANFTDEKWEQLARSDFDGNVQRARAYYAAFDPTDLRNKFASWIDREINRDEGLVNSGYFEGSLEQMAGRVWYLLNQFMKLQKQRKLKGAAAQIENYTFEQLDDLIDQDTTKGDPIAMLKERGATIVSDTDRWVVVEVPEAKAADTIGCKNPPDQDGTQDAPWCTRFEENFDAYTFHGPLIFILAKRGSNKITPRKKSFYPGLDWASAIGATREEYYDDDDAEELEQREIEWQNGYNSPVTVGWIEGNDARDLFNLTPYRAKDLQGAVPIKLTHEERYAVIDRAWREKYGPKMKRVTDQIAAEIERGEIFTGLPELTRAEIIKRYTNWEVGYVMDIPRFLGDLIHTVGGSWKIEFDWDNVQSNAHFFDEAVEEALRDEQKMIKRLYHNRDILTKQQTAISSQSKLFNAQPGIPLGQETRFRNDPVSYWDADKQKWEMGFVTRPELWDAEYAIVSRLTGGNRSEIVVPRRNVTLVGPRVHGQQFFELPPLHQFESMVAEELDEPLTESNLSREKWEDIAAGFEIPVQQAKEYLAEFDPTGSRNKYADWIWEHVKDAWSGFRAVKELEQIPVATFPDYVKKLLGAFHELKTRRKLKGPDAEINNYTVADLLKLVGRDAEVADPIHMLEQNGGRIIYEDDRFVVVEIPDPQAAEEVGIDPNRVPGENEGKKSAPWCTRFAENFESYTDGGPLIFVLSKQGAGVRPRKKSFYPGLDWFAATGAVDENSVEFQDGNNDNVDHSWFQGNKVADLVDILNSRYDGCDLRQYVRPPKNTLRAFERSWGRHLSGQFYNALRDFVIKARRGEVWDNPEVNPEMRETVLQYLENQLKLPATSEESAALWDTLIEQYAIETHFIWHETDGEWDLAIDPEQVVRGLDHVPVLYKLLKHYGEWKPFSSKRYSRKQSLLFPPGTGVDEDTPGHPYVVFKHPDTGKWERGQLYGPWREGDHETRRVAFQKDTKRLSPVFQCVAVPMSDIYFQEVGGGPFGMNVPMSTDIHFEDLVNEIAGEPLEEARLNDAGWVKARKWLENEMGGEWDVDQTKEWFSRFQPDGANQRYSSWIWRNAKNNFGHGDDFGARSAISVRWNEVQQIIKKQLTIFDQMRRQRKLKGDAANIDKYDLQRLQDLHRANADPQAEIESNGGNIVHIDDTWTIIKLDTDHAGDELGGDQFGARSAPWCTRYASNFDTYRHGAGLFWVLSPESAGIEPHKDSPYTGMLWSAAIGGLENGQIEWQDGSNSSVDQDWVEENMAHGLYEILNDLYGRDVLILPLDEESVIRHEWNYGDTGENFLDGIAALADEAEVVWQGKNPQAIERAVDLLDKYLFQYGRHTRMGQSSGWHLGDELDRFVLQIMQDSGIEWEFEYDHSEQVWEGQLDTEFLIDHIMESGPEYVIFYFEPKAAKATGRSLRQQQVLFPIGGPLPSPWGLSGSTVYWYDRDTKEWKTGRAVDPGGWTDKAAMVFIPGKGAIQLPIEYVAPATAKVGGRHFLYPTPIGTFESMVKDLLGEGQTVCAWCKKLLRDSPEIDGVSQGICPECAKKLGAEIEDHPDAKKKDREEEARRPRDPEGQSDLWSVTKGHYIYEIRWDGNLMVQGTISGTYPEMVQKIEDKVDTISYQYPDHMKDQFTWSLLPEDEWLAKHPEGTVWESLVEESAEKTRLEQEVMKRLQKWPKYQAEIFYNPESKVLHVSYGDWEEAQDDPGESEYPSPEMVEVLLLGIENVNQVVLQPEAGPDEGRWIKLDWRATDKPIIDLELNPNAGDYGGRGLDGPHSDSAYWGHSAYLARGESFESMVGELVEAAPSKDLLQKGSQVLELPVHKLQSIVVQIDPTNERMRYGTWIVRELIRFKERFGGREIYNFDRRVDVMQLWLRRYERLRKRRKLPDSIKDIGQVHYAILHNVLKEIPTEYYETPEESAERILAVPDTAKVYEDRDWLIVSNDTVDGLQQLLPNSPWCLGDPEHSPGYVDWHAGSSDNNAYIIFKKTKPKPKPRFKSNDYALEYAAAVSKNSAGGHALDMFEWQNGQDEPVTWEWVEYNDPKGSLLHALQQTLGIPEDRIEEYLRGDRNEYMPDHDRFDGTFSVNNLGNSWFYESGALQEFAAEMDKAIADPQAYWPDADPEDARRAGEILKALSVSTRHPYTRKVRRKVLFDYLTKSLAWGHDFDFSAELPGTDEESGYSLTKTIDPTAVLRNVPANTVSAFRFSRAQSYLLPDENYPLHDDPGQTELDTAYEPETIDEPLTNIRGWTGNPYKEFPWLNDYVSFVDDDGNERTGYVKNLDYDTGLVKIQTEPLDGDTARGDLWEYPWIPIANIRIDVDWDQPTPVRTPRTPEVLRDPEVAAQQQTLDKAYEPEWREFEGIGPELVGTDVEFVADDGTTTKGNVDTYDHETGIVKIYSYKDYMDHYIPVDQVRVPMKWESFEDVVDRVLTEANLQQRQWEQYAQQFGMTVEQLQALAGQMDPTGKYATWLVRVALPELGVTPTDEQQADIRELLSQYDILKNRQRMGGTDTNIDAVSSVQNLRDMLDWYKSGTQASRSQYEQLRDSVASYGGEIVAHDGPWVVVNLPDLMSASDICQGSGWCIKDEEWTPYYLAQGPLYIVLSSKRVSPQKTSPFEGYRFALAINKREKNGVTEIRDATDEWPDGRWWQKNDKDGKLRSLLVPNFVDETSMQIMSGPHVSHKDFESAAFMYFLTEGNQAVRDYLTYRRDKAYEKAERTGNDADAQEARFSADDIRKWDEKTNHIRMHTPTYAAMLLDLDPEVEVEPLERITTPTQKYVRLTFPLTIEAVGRAFAMSDIDILEQLDWEAMLKAQSWLLSKLDKAWRETNTRGAQESMPSFASLVESYRDSLDLPYGWLSPEGKFRSVKGFSGHNQLGQVIISELEGISVKDAPKRFQAYEYLLDRGWARCTTDGCQIKMESPPPIEIVQKYVIENTQGQPARNYMAMDMGSGQVNYGWIAKRDLLLSKSWEEVHGKLQQLSADDNYINPDLGPFFGESFESMVEALSGDEMHMQAQREFGTTEDPREVGYIMTDGTWLDFSGKREGGTPGMRSYDHREVGRAFEDDPDFGGGTEGMYEFMSESGAIRAMPENGGATIVREPTGTQYRSLRDWWQNFDEWLLDIEPVEGEDFNYMSEPMDSAENMIGYVKRFFSARKWQASESFESMVEIAAQHTCPDCEVKIKGKWRTGTCDECKHLMRKTGEADPNCRVCDGTGRPICCRCEGTGIDQNRGESVTTPEQSLAAKGYRRAKPVGKKIGGSIYAHRQYEDQIVPEDILARAKEVLAGEYSEQLEQYNAIKYDGNTKTVTFQHSPDFDTADEPHVGLSVSVKPGGGQVKVHSPKQMPIWHHKWMWVDDDYQGFDVEAAKQRSLTWLPHVKKGEFSKIGSDKYWDSIKPRFESMVERIDYSSGRSPRARGAWWKKTSQYSKGFAQHAKMRRDALKPQPPKYEPGIPPYHVDLSTTDGSPVFSGYFDDYTDAKMSAENWMGDERDQNPDVGLVWKITDATGDEMEEDYGVNESFESMVERRGDFLVSAGESVDAEQTAAAKDALEKYADTHFDKFFRSIVPRFKFVLRDVKDSWRENRYEFDLVPRAAGRLRPSPHGRSPSHHYRDLQNAVRDDQVESDPEMAYRGMSWDEWQQAQKSGQIQSGGDYNLPGQEGITLFGNEFSTASYYAGGFSPVQHLPTRDRPGVVVEVPKSLLITPQDVENHVLASGELGAREAVPLSAVHRAWYIVPELMSTGYLQLIQDKLSGEVREGSRASPWGNRVAVPMPLNTFESMVEFARSRRKRDQDQYSLLLWGSDIPVQELHIDGRTLMRLAGSTDPRATQVYFNALPKEEKIRLRQEHPSKWWLHNQQVYLEPDDEEEIGESVESVVEQVDQDAPLIVVHAGSCLGSADSNIGDQADTNAIRAAMLQQVEAWRGPVVRVQTEIDEELEIAYENWSKWDSHNYGEFSNLMLEIPVVGDLSEAVDFDADARDAAAFLELQKGDKVYLTGGWRGHGGCVDALAYALQRQGYEPEILDTALRELFWTKAEIERAWREYGDLAFGSEPPVAESVTERIELTPEEITATNKTCRTGSGGSTWAQKSKVHDFFRQHFNPQMAGTVLDFGSGNPPTHTQALAKDGYQVAAHEHGDNFDPEVHTPNALSNEYDTVIASKVLNVQPNAEALDATIQQMKAAVKPGGMLIANYPEPHKVTNGNGPMKPAEVQQALKRHFPWVKFAKGTKSSPIFIAADQQPTKRESLLKMQGTGGGWLNTKNGWFQPTHRHDEYAKKASEIDNVMKARGWMFENGYSRVTEHGMELDPRTADLRAVKEFIERMDLVGNIWIDVMRGEDRGPSVEVDKDQIDNATSWDQLIRHGYGESFESMAEAARPPIVTWREAAAEGPNDLFTVQFEHGALQQYAVPYEVADHIRTMRSSWGQYNHLKKYATRIDTPESGEEQTRLFPESFESMLEQDPGNEGQLGPIITNLYEAEYKYNAVKHNVWAGEMDREAVLKTFGDMVMELGREVAMHLLPVFDDWLASHALTDPDLWAENALASVIEYGPADWNEMVDAVALWYNREKNAGGVSIPVNTYGRRPNYAEMLKRDLFQHDPKSLPSWLQFIEALRADDESLWDDPKDPYPFEDAEEFWYEVEGMGYDLAGMLDMAAAHYGNDHAEQMMKEIYRELVFPVWLARWEAEGIRETRDRIQDARDELFRVARGGGQTPKDVSKVVNVALNIAHQTGPMLDYIQQEYPEVTDDFLTGLSERDTSDWDEELAQLGVMPGQGDDFGRQALMDLWRDRAARGESLEVDDPWEFRPPKPAASVYYDRAAEMAADLCLQGGLPFETATEALLTCPLPGSSKGPRTGDTA